MGLRILEISGTTGGAVLHCSTTEWVFGPRFSSYDEADDFIMWMREVHGVDDLRGISENKLLTKHTTFRSIITRQQLRRLFDEGLIHTGCTSSYPAHRFDDVPADVSEIAKDVPFQGVFALHTRKEINQLDFLMWLVEKAGVEYTKSDEPELRAIAIVLALIEFSGYLPEDHELVEWGITSDV